MTLDKYKRLCIVTIPILIVAGIFFAFNVINNSPYLIYSCNMKNCLAISETGIKDKFWQDFIKKQDNAILVDDDSGNNQWKAKNVFFGLNDLISDVYLEDFKSGGDITAVKKPGTTEDLPEFSALLGKSFTSAFLGLDIPFLANDPGIQELQCLPPLMLYTNGTAKINCDINGQRAQIYVAPYFNRSIDQIIKLSDELVFETKKYFLILTIAPTLVFLVLSGLIYLIRRAVRYVSIGK